MTHSYTDLAAARSAGLREGHRIWFGVPVSDGIYYRADYLPAGFLVSSAGDLGHYVTALLDGGRYRGTSVLGPRYVAQMLAPSTDASALGQHKTYGFGYYQERIGAAPVVTHPAARSTPGQTSSWCRVDTQPRPSSAMRSPWSMRSSRGSTS